MNYSTKEPCAFTAKPASKTIEAIPVKMARPKWQKVRDCILQDGVDDREIEKQLKEMKEEWIKEKKKEKRKKNFVELVAESAGLKPKAVKGTINHIFRVAAEQLKKSGSINLAGMLKLKLKVKPATPAHKGTNPFTKKKLYIPRKTSIEDD